MPAFGLGQAALLAGSGVVLGTALVAALTPLGPRLGVPSVIVLPRGARAKRRRPRFSRPLRLELRVDRGEQRDCRVRVRRLFRRTVEREMPWALDLGLLATAVVARGPRAVARADRVAVPLLIAVGVALTFAICLPARPARRRRPERRD